jgi:hypothetical protein
MARTKDILVFMPQRRLWIDRTGGGQTRNNMVTITSNIYDGEDYHTQDPAGKYTCNTFDDAGRKTVQILDCTSASSSSSSFELIEFFQQRFVRRLADFRRHERDHLVRLHAR